MFLPYFKISKFDKTRHNNKKSMYQNTNFTQIYE